MQKFSLNKIIGFFVLMILQIGMVFTEEPLLKFAYSEVEFFPFQAGNGTEIANPPGVAVELISEAAKDLGITIVFVRYPNKRVQSSLKDGSVQGAFCFSFSPDRLDMGAYPMKDGKPDSTQRITTVSYFLYKLKTSPLTWDGKTLGNLNGYIGANAGNSIVEILKKLGLPVEEAKYPEQNLFKLKAGRIDAYAAQDITIERQLKTEQYKDILPLSIPLVTKDYFLVLSKQFVAANPDLARQLWAKISELRELHMTKLLIKYPEPSLP